MVKKEELDHNKKQKKGIKNSGNIDEYINNITISRDNIKQDQVAIEN